MIMRRRLFTLKNLSIVAIVMTLIVFIIGFRKILINNLYWNTLPLTDYSQIFLFIFGTFGLFILLIIVYVMVFKKDK